MIQYKDYINRIVDYYDATFESDFNDIIKLFPNLQEIDWSEYFPEDSDLIYFIFNYLINSVYSDAYVDDHDEHNKSITLSYARSLKELEDLKEVFGNNGWTIDNYEELKKELEEEETETKELEAKEKLILEIKNRATLDQLQNFIEEL